MSKTPEVLVPALRQYQHNKPTGELIAGFDFEETCGIVCALQAALIDAREIAIKAESYSRARHLSEIWGIPLENEDE